MAKFLINWRFIPQMLLSSPEERMKLLQSINEMIEAGVRSGKIMDWGVYCDGSGGYALSEGSESELYANLIKWKPCCDFDAKPVLTIDQVLDIFENASKQGLAASSGTPINNSPDSLISDIHDL